jgi:hypothetical protein
MIVTEDGALSMAARGCKDEYDGAPATMPLLDYLMREHTERPFDDLEKMARRTAQDLCDDPDAYVWVALGKRRSASETNPVYGYYTQAERKKALQNHLPAGNQPGNQARVRAVKRWVRENFPEARQQMLEYTSELNRRSAGALEAQAWIDAEYKFITEAGDKALALQSPVGQKSSKSRATKKTETVALEQAPEGDDELKIDQDWFDETLKLIHWSEATCKSWIASNLQVEIKGDLKEGISQLPRDKGRLLFRELQNRRDNIQPGLL